jgi:hypothetical protein
MCDGSRFSFPHRLLLNIIMLLQILIDVYVFDAVDCVPARDPLPASNKNRTKPFLSRYASPLIPDAYIARVPTSHLFII